jgi:hypothetical protein
LKVNRGVMRRLEVAEKKLGSTAERKYVVTDFDGHYYGACGYNLSQEQFDAWAKQQGMGVEIVIIKYTIDGGNLLGKAVLNCLTEAQKNPALPTQDKR